MEIKKALISITEHLNLNETTHSYKLGDLILPSVSEIIKPLSQKVYGDIDDWSLSLAAEKGTNIHFDIEQYIKTGWKPTLTEENEGYLNAFSKAYEEIKNKNFVDFRSELRIFSPTYLYAGTLDLLLIDKNKDSIIVDFKTTSSIHEKLWSVQLTGYKKIIEEAGIKVREMYVLHLSKNGKYQFIQLQDQTGVFMACYLINKFI